MSINFPNIDPVIFEIGPFAVKWYGLAYVIGLIGGVYLLKFLDKKNKTRNLNEKAYEDLLIYLVFGIILGGRIGYVLFYGASFYAAYPIEIFKVWKGGMSFHGGAAGMAVACYVFCKKHKVDFLKFADMAVISSTIGLFCGRIANFINAEIYGRVTDVAWGVVFPRAGASPRHPSQIYEALLEGALMFVILYYMYNNEKIRHKKGMIFGTFFVLYSTFRTFVENYREPDSHIGFYFGSITTGQLLSMPMAVIGVLVVVYAMKRKNSKKLMKS